MNKIQENAIAFRELLNKEYYFCLAHKNKNFLIRLKFYPENFHHLEGLEQLKDIKIHSISGNKSFNMAINGDITEEMLKVSSFYESRYIKNKIDFLGLLEKVIDDNETTFMYSPKDDKLSKIQAKLFLYTNEDGNDIYVYLDLGNDNEIDYYCRSLVVNPSYDRRQNQTKLTTLWKEKIDIDTLNSDVLFQYKTFIPRNLRISEKYREILYKNKIKLEDRIVRLCE